MKRSIQEIIGANIRSIRVAQNMTQTRLALMASMSKAYLCDIEAGRINITTRTLERLASCLDVEVVALLADSDKNE
jgi:transcriptional regulator with XRE-family HTH domain